MTVDGGTYWSPSTTEYDRATQTDTTIDHPFLEPVTAPPEATCLGSVTDENVAVDIVSETTADLLPEAGVERVIFEASVALVP